MGLWASTARVRFRKEGSRVPRRHGDTEIASGLFSVSPLLRVCVSLFCSEDGPMTLPKKEEKGYLEIQDAGKGFVIVARKEDAVALAALFVQYGISCQRKEAKAGAEVTFQFSEGMERAQVESVLTGYKTAKGS